MAPRKSQEELESPAKVYQLDALDTKIDTVINQLTTIQQQTASVVTPAQLEARIEKSEEDMKEYTDNQVKLVHSEYGPLKKGAWIIVSAVIVGIVTQVLLNIYGGS